MHKSLILPCMLITVLVSCKSYYYVYDVEMIHPVQSKALIYQNDTMSVEFGLEPKDISITMTNKTDEGIKINWDDVSFSLFGNANRIVHKETSYLGHTLAQPSTTIPPHTKLKDILIRSKDVHFYSAGNNSFLVIDNLFPDYDFGNNRTATMVAGLKGSQINIFLPFYVGETRISKYYILSIKDILKYKKNPKNFMLGKTPNQIGSLKVKTKK